MNATVTFFISEIGASLFQGCTSLTSITIPDSVTELEGSIFSYCTELTEVTLGENIDIIHTMFNACPNLKAIKVKAGSLTENRLLKSEYADLVVAI